MQNVLTNLLLPIAEAEPQKRKRWLYWLWAGLLFIAGALVWGKFFNWGSGSYAFADWKDITLPRTAFLMNAMRHGVVPLHIADPYPLGGITDRFQSIPDMLLSPQILLLRWLDILPFLMLNFLLLYAVGFAGLLWLGRKLRLSLLGLTALFLLFNFNGHLVAHFAEGHYTWTACFLFPWLIGLVIELINGAGGWGWVLRLSLLQFVILLQGGYHQFIWGLFLLALLIPVLPGKFTTLLRALIFAVLINTVRVLPAVLNLGGFNNIYIGGYPFVQTIWFALTQSYLPADLTYNYHLTETLGTWEFAMFVGLTGVAFLGWFGVVRAFQRRGQPGNHAVLLFPALGFILLSMDQAYRYLRILLPLPWVTGERVPARMSLMAVLLVLVLAVTEFQHWLDDLAAADRQAAEMRTPRWSTGILLGCFVALALLFHDLWQNLYLWRISAAAAAFGTSAFEAQHWAVTNHPDAAYQSLLILGGAISLAALLALLYFSFPRRKNSS